jgi:hypothetical protein
VRGKSNIERKEGRGRERTEIERAGEKREGEEE